MHTLTVQWPDHCFTTSDEAAQVANRALSDASKALGINEPNVTMQPRTNAAAVLDDADSLASAVFQALGAASTCWESLAGTGVFDSTRARAIGDELVDGIRERRWPDPGNDERPFLGYARTRELLEEIRVRIEMAHPEGLDYRTVSP